MTGWHVEAVAEQLAQRGIADGPTMAMCRAALAKATGNAA